MKNEIGSIFEISRDILGNDNELDLLFLEKLNKKNIRLTTCGREAIELAIKNIENKYSEKLEKKCVLPMYTCDSVIIPFEKYGWDIRYYDINKDFSIDLNNLEKIMSDFCPTVLLLHGYYGIPISDEVNEYIREKQKYGLIYIEDLTQNMNQNSIADNPDYFVGSLRKWFPIVDGGFVATNNGMIDLLNPVKRDFVSDKMDALTMKYDYLYYDKSNKGEFLSKSRMAEDYLYENDSICEMSSESKFLLNHVDIKDTYAKRSKNAIVLWDELQSVVQIKMGITNKRFIHAPLYFPIFVEDRQELQQFLTDHDVYAPVLWPVPEQIDMMSENVDCIFKHLLALPCDFRYGANEMHRIAELIKNYYER